MQPHQFPRFNVNLGSHWQSQWHPNRSPVEKFARGTRRSRVFRVMEATLKHRKWGRGNHNDEIASRSPMGLIRVSSVPISGSIFATDFHG